MRILVGLSGGIDSTYAAARLKKEGHEIEGACLIMHSYTELDLARRAAAEIGIPLHEIDVKCPFSEKIIPYFINEYTRARTPNPCIVCNREVKFKYLLKYALDNGFDAIATGHYAKITKISAKKGVRHALSFAKDASKDQTYMLYRLGEDVLSRLILPLSDMTKEQVRLEAEKMGITAADRPESQEICFIPDGDYASYIEERVGACPDGDFVAEDGAFIGKHKGIIRYTVGQRKGLGVAAGARIFVTDINPENGKITLSYNEPTSLSFTVCGLVFTGTEPLSPGEKRAFLVKQRYRAKPVPCIVSYVDSDTVNVSLDAPIKAVTPGQSAVFYDGNTVAFGGFIN